MRFDIRQGFPRLAAIAFVILLLGLHSTAVYCQKQAAECETGSKSAGVGFWTWDAGSHVKVYVRKADFAAEELPHLLKPLALWDSVAESTGSGVRLTYAGTTPEELDCQNCLTIRRARIFNGKTRHGSELDARGVVGTQIIRYGIIRLDQSLSGPATLTNAVAHELGHSFGLVDCYNCKSGSTVMIALSGTSSSNQMEGPSRCDIAQVRSAYRKLKLRPRPIPLVAVKEDEGEEPVEDDTPIVVPDRK